MITGALRRVSTDENKATWQAAETREVLRTTRLRLSHAQCVSYPDTHLLKQFPRHLSVAIIRRYTSARVAEESLSGKAFTELTSSGWRGTMPVLIPSLRLTSVLG